MNSKRGGHNEHVPLFQSRFRPVSPYSSIPNCRTSFLKPRSLWAANRILASVAWIRPGRVYFLK